MSDTPLMAVPRVDVDDERVRVTEWCFEPGARTGHHRLVALVVKTDLAHAAHHHTGTANSRPRLEPADVVEIGQDGVAGA